MNKNSVALRAADIAECAIFVALMVAGAYIKIPFPFMPLTFQTAFAILAGLLLGWKKGMIAMAAYAVMGLAGVPVFTTGGGIFYVTLPSFGYILGFIACAGVAGLSFTKYSKLWQIILFSFAALITDYAFGVAYFAAVWVITGNAGLGGAIVSYNLIYLPKDAVLTALAAFLAAAVAPAIKKMHGKSGGARKGGAQKNSQDNKAK